MARGSDPMDVLKKAWHRWKAFGQWLGDQVARVFLVAFYFTVALPFGLLVRWTQDPLERRLQPGWGWTPRQVAPPTLAQAERPY
jgi:hypothetical protein